MWSLQSLLDRLAGSHANRLSHRRSDSHPTARFLRSAIVRDNGRPAAIRVGEQTVICGELLVYPDGGTLTVGRHCFIGPGSRIWSGAEIQIGDRVLISHNVNIHDANAHSLSAAERHRHIVEILIRGNAALGDVPKAPILIEDDAWIGFNATVLRGVRVGQGAVVAACATVTRDVEPFTIVAGTPAVPIGKSSK
jgi:acetyltransferase-like isoleucine patch superfamily enzyme